MRIELLDAVSSTNDYIKKYMGRGENVIVCAKSQSAGRGTKGRSFLSDAGGVYLSALIFPHLAPSEAFRVMSHAATAVCKTLCSFGIAPSIKWANDVLIGTKKCAGILIENTLRGGEIYESVIGIGLNVSNDVQSLKGVACSMKDVLKSPPPPVERVRDVLIENFCKESTFEEYLSFVGFLGQKVLVMERESYYAVARRILPDGRLEVERDGEKILLSAGEISIKIEGGRG